MKIVKSKTTGKLFCLDCEREKCNCLPEMKSDTITTDDIYEKYWSDIEIHKIKMTGKNATLFLLKQNILPNGKKIKIWSEIWIPDKYWTTRGSKIRIKVDNRFLNKLRTNA